MAWHFYGFSEHREIQGPLPRKRWIAKKGERHKLSRKPAQARCGRPDVNTQAEAYARWLADRDGITIPEGLASRAVTGWFESKHRTVKRKFWNGVRPVPFTESRPRAVHFCPVVQPARRSIYSGGSDAVLGEPVVTIELPNWNFDPAEPVEGTLPLAVAA